LSANVVGHLTRPGRDRRRENRTRQGNERKFISTTLKLSSHSL